uniref:Uncharacterized protein n=1 Tax=Astyanax mexicanus TaxID=7994 RepID=A0A8B9RNW8_ASTMX
LHAGFTTAVWVLALLSSLNHPAPMLKKRLKDISPALKKTKQWKNCLTFENQEAIGEVQEGELSAEEMEDDLAHPMPDLLLVLGGRPLKEQGAISVWQMTLNES